MTARPRRLAAMEQAGCSLRHVEVNLDVRSSNDPDLVIGASTSSSKPEAPFLSVVADFEAVHLGGAPLRATNLRAAPATRTVRIRSLGSARAFAPAGRCEADAVVTRASLLACATPGSRPAPFRDASFLAELSLREISVFASHFARFPAWLSPDGFTRAAFGVRGRTTRLRASCGHTPDVLSHVTCDTFRDLTLLGARDKAQHTRGGHPALDRAPGSASWIQGFQPTIRAYSAWGLFTRIMRAAPLLGFCLFRA